jgi:hypothetical protein
LLGGARARVTVNMKPTNIILTVAVTAIPVHGVHALVRRFFCEVEGPGRHEGGCRRWRGASISCR